MQPVGLIGRLTMLTSLFAAGFVPAAAQENVSAQQSDCGTVSIAKLNWPSAAIIAEIDAFILAHGYGCEITLVPGDTLSTLTSMVENGQPDLSPETWINSERDLLDAAVADRDLHYLSQVFADGGIEGWWIPAYIAEAHPHIQTIADALDHPDLFKGAAGDDGVIHSCPEGWSCAISTANLFKAYDGDEKGFTLKTAESGDALTQSIAEAFRENRGWLGYYWAPTATLGRFDMVKLSFDAPYNEEVWHTCMVDPDCVAPQITAWPRSEVYTVATDRFMRRANGAAGYVKARSYSNSTLNELLAWRTETDASAQETARRFLSTQESLWSEWVSEEAAANIRSALGEAQ